MDKIARVGVDLAKKIMQIHAVDSVEHVAIRKACPQAPSPEIREEPFWGASPGHAGPRARSADTPHPALNAPPCPSHRDASRRAPRINRP